MPTFTRDGYKVADVPKPLYEKLRNAVMDGVNRWDTLRSEGNIDVIYTKDVRLYYAYTQYILTCAKDLLVCIELTP